METLQIRKELHKIIDLGDETFIRVFYAMATEYKKTAPKIMIPFTKAQSSIKTTYEYLKKEVSPETAQKVKETIINKCKSLKKFCRIFKGTVFR